MSAVELPVVSSPVEPATPLLRTLALCDLVDSTGLIERLGDHAAAALMRKHDRLARDLLHRFGGQEIDKTDGFLVLFERPIHAVAFAVAYQRSLIQLGEAEKVSLKARVGIHVGDVMVWQNDTDDVLQGAKPVEVEGLVKPVTARLASLALPGQILVSGVAAALAQRAHEELGVHADRTRWMHHGRFRFKGVPEPLVVYEVGEAGIAPLSLPPYSGKAWREVPWWRRPATMFVEAAVALVLVASVLWFVFRPQPAIAFIERDWVVIGDLQNYTTQRNFEDSLRSALRIGLEQSKYVNIVPDLQLRDSLSRMKSPSSTRIDRRTGSQIALRENARALIVPTVAEIGGKIRVSAEVIDPTTEATVYVETVEGDADSVVQALDTLNKRLRGRLGETLAAIESHSMPLPKVSTENIDALRAYALGEKAQASGKFDEASALYEQALKLDSRFALARIGLARIHLSTGDESGFREHVRLAAELRDRLPPRESLVLDAFQARLAGSSAFLAKWKLLATLYPDYPAGNYNYALFNFSLANDFKSSLPYAKAAATEHNPFRASANFLVGALYVGLDEPSAAEEYFERARKLGIGGSLTAYADFEFSRRNYAKAAAILKGERPSGIDRTDARSQLSVIAGAVDRGDWVAARATLKSLVAQFGTDPSQVRAIATSTLALDALGGADVAVDEVVRAASRAASTRFESAESNDRENALFDVVLVGYVAARLGQLSLARQSDALAAAHSDLAQQPALIRLRRVLSAEVARASAKSDEAIQSLRESSDGTELYQAHRVLMESYADTGNVAAALEQADWLANHRGRAFAESVGDQVLQLFNVADANLALLRAAEISIAGENHPKAAEYLKAFRRAWSDPSGVTGVDARVSAVEKALQSKARP
ncbi:putative peptide modification system cyclase [Tahibacter amnicola]|uniref:Peptide modification system cyclase n=1 Tax=Tahibacter amnicola TaxID=2976241 RepID=A0ABY6BJF6_9GAMM|nr:putative peptide modification system cyclase [Tahibacter amnicola]UXI68515.1 putative peptide modification system cyclase [Tahibacter amnicola]